MSNVILKFKTVEGEEIRIAASSIVSYEDFTSYVVVSTQSTSYNVQTTAKLLDDALIESYFMVKEVLV